MKIRIKDKLSLLFYRLKEIPPVSQIDYKVYTWGDDSSYLTKEIAVPKIAWLFWDSEEIPAIIKICIQKIKELNGDYTVNILSKNSLKLFLEEDFDINMYNNLEAAQFSDLIRLEILYKYGGVWIDASILFFESLEVILEEINLQENVFLINIPDFHAKNDIPVFENWFIIAKPNDPFIYHWKEKTKQLLLNYTDEEFVKISGLDSYVQNIPSQIYTYLRQHIAAQMVLKNWKIEYGCLKIKTCSAHRLGFSLAIYNKSENVDARYCAKVLCYSKMKKPLPYFVKLNSHMRTYIAIMINEIGISRKSIMFDIKRKYRIDKF